MVKLNMDGAAKNTLDRGGLGGIFRDWNGNWLLGFCEALAFTKPLKAELKIVRKGM